MSPSASRTWSVPAEPGVVGRLRRDVVGHVRDQGVGDPPLSDLAVAVSEAITNAVLHAFRDGRSGSVCVECEAEPGADQVMIVVRDDGVGMAPNPDTPGLGLGLPLIAELANSLEVRSAEHGAGTELRMTFAVPVEG